MSNFTCLNKPRIQTYRHKIPLIFFAALFLLGSKKGEVSESLQKAKQLMLQGQRKQALVVLDHASSQASSKSELHELLAKRTLFLEQFFTTDSFQAYQAAKALDESQRWDDCLRELETIKPGDQNNVLVLRAKMGCQKSLKQFDNSNATLALLLELVPADITATLDRVENFVLQKKSQEALKELSTVSAKTSPEIERYAILKAKILIQTEKITEAVEVLKSDQETYLDHIAVLYELGSLYSILPGNDWQARKTLSLFMTRCKRFKDSELKAKGFENMVQDAQITLAKINKKLGV